jgi:DNA-directed RNA polymerase subunit RPC12/RpoP
MTIKFYCPNCDAIIAFDSKRTGKRARCLTCGQIFIIPKKNDEIPKKIKAEPEYKGKPIPGFYHAVFIDSWKLFSDPQNVTSLAFVVAVVCFKFFLAKACCMNYILFVVVWGWLLAFYLNIIYETAFEIDQLPQIQFSASAALGEAAYVWYIIKPFLIFLYTMFIVQLPFIIALALLEDKGITYENMWQERTGLHLLLQALFILGLFLFPMAILTTAVGKDLTLLRPDYIIVPILKAFMPYLTVVALLVAACLLETQTKQFKGSTFAITVGNLALNLAVQLIAIIAMRSIGLFYRHYSCRFRW